MEDTYFVSSVAKLTGTTTRQIREWTKHGYLGEVPEINWGKHKAPVYSQDHVDRVVMIVKFKEEGYTLQAAVLLMQEQFEKANEVKLDSTVG